MPADLRVLVLSADVGESHARMARVLAAELEQLPEVASVAIRNDFSVLGPALGETLGRGFRFHLGGARWSYEAAYGLFAHVHVAQRLGEQALYALGGSALAATIERQAPDVVVSTYPVMNPVLAGLRAAGRCGCPVAAVVGPLGGHAFWVHPGLDLHMTHYPEAVPAIARLARGAPVEAVRPLVAPEFFEPRSRADARRDLGIDASGRVALVSGGGWGAGDLGGALDACLALPGVRLLAVTGHNAAARAALQARYAAESRVTVMGFTERMRDLLRAADVLVTSTAGLSCVEARLCGCPMVIYGFPVGHVRDNTAALVRHGLARAAQSPAALAGAVDQALRAGCPPVLLLAQLPSAAQRTVALAKTAYAAA